MSPLKPGRPRRSDHIPLSEAAAMIGVSTRTVQRMMTDGLIAFRTTPRGYRKPYRSSVEEYCRLNIDNQDTRG